MTRAEAVAGAFASIRAGSKSFRAASRLFDRTTRERASLLYCWCRHCDDVCDGQTLGRGQSERGSVTELTTKTALAAAGVPLNDPPFDALRLLLAECPIPRRLIDDHLAGFALDEDGWQPATEADLERYCYHVAGSVGCMMAIVMGVAPDDEETLEHAADLGIAFQLSNIARDIREDLEAGRCYLPRDWLDEFGLTPQSLLAPANRPGLTAIVARLVASVGVHEASARRGVGRLPFRSRLAVLAALRIYGAIGRDVGRLGGDAWDRRVTIGKTRKLAFLVPSLAEALRIGRRG
ncbi:MAG: phytoene/squalene synthase family protein [Sphingomicrobium sp.]